MRIASLPWYDLPSTHSALQAFWSILREALAEEGVDRLPHALEHRMPLETQWAHADLLISQCCGLDLFTASGRRLEPIARMVFDDLPCSPGSYFSHIIAAPGLDPRRARVVINSSTSRSGCTALLRWMRDRGWAPREISLSGSHQASVEWIRRGRADLAAIDAQTWRWIDGRGVEIVGRSAESPAPVFVRPKRSDVPAPVLLRALECAVLRGGAPIGLRGVIASDRDVFDAIADDAVRLGVPGISRSLGEQPGNARHLGDPRPFAG